MDFSSQTARTQRGCSNPVSYRGAKAQRSDISEIDFFAFSKPSPNRPRHGLQSLRCRQATHRFPSVRPSDHLTIWPSIVRPSGHPVFAFVVNPENSALRRFAPPNPAAETIPHLGMRVDVRREASPRLGPLLHLRQVTPPHPSRLISIVVVRFEPDPDIVPPDLIPHDPGVAADIAVRFHRLPLTRKGRAGARPRTDGGGRRTEAGSQRVGGAEGRRVGWSESQTARWSE